MVDVDSDEAPGDLSVTLNVNNGTLTLASTAGLSFGAGGDGQASMTFTGTLASVSSALSTVTYRGIADYNGPDTFDVSVNDLGNTGIGGVLADAGMVGLTVNPVVDIAPDTTTINEDSAGAWINVLANDNFEGTPGVTVAPIDQPENGSVVMFLNTPIYTPNADWNGIDTFTYTVVSGGVTETATVTVTVNSIPDVVDDTVSTAEDTVLVIDVLGTDSFAVTATVTAVTQPTNGSVAITNGGADVTYTPNDDWNGTGVDADTFTYTVSNGGADETATVTVDVTAVVDIVADAATVARSVPWSIDLMGGAGADNFEDAAASITSVTTPTVNGGAVVITGTGSVEYTSDPAYVGIDTFDYTVTAGGVTETATVTVTVEDIYRVTINWTDTGDGSVTASEGAAPGVAPISPFNTWTPKSASGEVPTSLVVWAKQGDVLSFTAAPGSLYGANGSRFVQWGDGETTTVHSDITIGAADVSLTVEFAQLWQVDRSVTGEVAGLNPITATPALPSDPEVIDEALASADYAFSPIDGYFVNLIVDGVTEVSSSFPVSRQFINITADHTMEANVMMNPRVTATVLASDEDGLTHGSITPGGTTSHFHGETPTFSIDAEDGWCVESVQVDGAEVWDNTGTTNYITHSSNHHTYQFNPLTRAGTNDYETTAVFRQPWVFTGTISPFMAQAVWQGAGSWSLYDEDQGIYVAQNMDHLNTVTLPCDSRNFTFYVHDQGDCDDGDAGRAPNIAEIAGDGID